MEKLTPVEKYNLLKDFVEADGRNFEEDCMAVYTTPTKEIKKIMTLDDGFDKLMKKFNNEDATKGINICLKLKIYNPKE